jgi:TatD DNase family protein
MDLVSFVDSHAHLSKDETYDDLEGLILRAQASGIKAIINICTNVDTLHLGLELSKQYPWIYNTASTTPHDVEKEGELFFPLVEKNARQGDLVAIGETGLDYFHQHSDPEIQKKYLRLYLRLALDCHLPVVIHCREAFKDLFDILDSDYRLGEKYGPGVLHCFTGTVEEAQQVLERGWFLSLSGIVTFKKSEELRQVAKMVPLNQLLIETDSPYLAPQNRRGKVNEPAFLIETAETIAKLKGISLKELSIATLENSSRLFKIKLEK